MWTSQLVGPDSPPPQEPDTSTHNANGNDIPFEEEDEEHEKRRDNNKEETDQNSNSKQSQIQALSKEEHILVRFAPFFGWFLAVWALLVTYVGTLFFTQRLKTFKKRLVNRRQATKAIPGLKLLPSWKVWMDILWENFSMGKSDIHFR